MDVIKLAGLNEAYGLRIWAARSLRCPYVP